MVTRNQQLNKRMNYFERQFLRAQDLADEQDYHLDRRWRHNQYLHTPGIIDGGLRVVQARRQDGTLDPTSVTVEPGRAIDADGREIVLLSPSTVTIPEGASSIDISIRYRELASDPNSLQGIQGNTRMDDTPEVGPGLPDKALLLAHVDLKDGQLSIDEPRSFAGARINPIPIAQLSAKVVFDTGETPISVSAAPDSGPSIEHVEPMFTAAQPAFLLLSVSCHVPDGSPLPSCEWWQRVSVVGDTPPFQHQYALVIRNPNKFPITVSCKAYQLNET